MRYKLIIDSNVRKVESKTIICEIKKSRIVTTSAFGRCPGLILSTGTEHLFEQPDSQLLNRLVVSLLLEGSSPMRGRCETFKT